MKDFIESNQRNPSRYNPEERFKYCNWLKHNKKLLNAGELSDYVPAGLKFKNCHGKAN